MTSKEFNELMHTECSHCLQDAGHHRLTPTGRFYCLIFNTLNMRWARSAYPVISDRQALACRVKVNELVRSPLPQSVGKLINSQLRNLPEAQGEQLAL